MIFVILIFLFFKIQLLLTFLIFFVTNIKMSRFIDFGNPDFYSKYQDFKIQRYDNPIKTFTA